MRRYQDIIDDLRNFIPEDDDWTSLEKLLEELWSTNKADRDLETLFRLFEKFPEDDGEGVLWSVLQGIESFSDYETELLNSLNRQPSHLCVVMLKRIVNTGRKEVDGMEVVNIISALESNGRTPASVKRDIEKLLK